jgi:hypothetical protein
MTDRTTAIALVFVALAAVSTVATACDSSPTDNFKRRDNAPEDPSAPKCTDTGKAYAGFAGTKLEEKRVNAAIGDDRARIKPYSALKGEYERTIGVVPASLEAAAPSFGNPPDRFSSEPRASAIQVYSAFRVAFDGCLTYTAKATKYGAAPTQETASAECTAMARKFWSRAPTAGEVSQCAQVATVDSASETAPRRRWAYTCATLLSAAGFLTY